MIDHRALTIVVGALGMYAFYRFVFQPAWKWFSEACGWDTYADYKHGLD